MSNQTIIYLIESEKFLNQTIAEQAFADFVETSFGGEVTVPADATAMPLVPWLRQKLAQINAKRNVLDFQELEVIDFVRECSPGIYHLADFPSAGGLAMDLEHLQPLLPDQFQARIEHILGDSGSPLPPDMATELSILHDCHPTWTFFTRQEIIDIRPLVLEFIEDPLIDCFDAEWHQVVTAHERYAYDWLAFYYQF
jgi:hypothetical protein